MGKRKTGSYHVVRGGSWTHYAESARCATRNSHTPVGRLSGFGFRLVLAGPGDPQQGCEDSGDFTIDDREKADPDLDGDVDGFDFLTFTNCYNGSDRAPLCP